MKTILIILLSLFLVADKPNYVIIRQQEGTRFPRFGYTPVKDRVMRVQFPIEFIVENPTDTDTEITMIDYRTVSGYGMNKRLGWWGVDLLEDRGDTLISIADRQRIQRIYPEEKRHYIIFTEHTVYDDTLFHSIFKKQIDIMRQDSAPEKKFINPETLTSFQLAYLRGMLSKDSLKIILAHNEACYRAFIPIDVNKVIPLHTKKDKHSEILKTIRDEGIE